MGRDIQTLCGPPFRASELTLSPQISTLSQQPPLTKSPNHQLLGKAAQSHCRIYISLPHYSWGILVRDTVSWGAPAILRNANIKSWLTGGQRSTWSPQPAGCQMSAFRAAWSSVMLGEVGGGRKLWPNPHQ